MGWSPNAALAPLVDTRGLRSEGGAWTVDGASADLRYAVTVGDLGGDHACGFVLECRLDELGDVELAVFPGAPRQVRTDHETGDARFDDRFVINGSSAALVPVWVDARVRDALDTAYSPVSATPCRLELAGSIARVRAAIRPDDAPSAAAVLAVMDAVVTVPDRVAGRWGALAASLGNAPQTGPRWPLASGAHLVLGRPAGPVMVSWRAVGRTAVELWATPRVPPVRLVARGALTAEGRRRPWVSRTVAGSGAAPWSVDARATGIVVELPGIVEDAVRIGSAIDLAVTLAESAPPKPTQIVRGPRALEALGDRCVVEHGWWPEACIGWVTAPGRDYALDARVNPIASVHDLRISIVTLLGELGDARIEVFGGRPRRREHELGDALFDDAYVVKSQTPALLPIWLDAPVRGALLDTRSAINHDPCRIGIRNGFARVASSLRADDATGARLVIAVLDAIAGVPARQRARWERLAAALGTASTEGWPFDAAPIRFERNGGTAAVSWRLAPAVVTEVRVRLRRDGAAIAPRFDEIRDVLLASHVAIEAGELVASLRGTLEDPARLATLTDRLLAIAAPNVTATGPYR